jgi:hypothetical protein
MASFLLTFVTADRDSDYLASAGRKEFPVIVVAGNSIIDPDFRFSTHLL